MLSSWNLHWSSSKSVCLGWCLRCGYSFASCRATHSVLLLSWHTLYSWWWTVGMSETCRVLYQINMRNSASRWLSLWENAQGWQWAMISSSFTTYFRHLLIASYFSRRYFQPKICLPIYWYSVFNSRQVTKQQICGFHACGSCSINYSVSCIK